MDPLKEKLTKTVCDLYEQRTKDFQPLYPWILIRVLPKEQKIGSLWVPDGGASLRQNKTIYEGVVLQVYKPYDVYFTPNHQAPLTIREHINKFFKTSDGYSKFVIEDVDAEFLGSLIEHVEKRFVGIQKETMYPVVKPGDHVIFPHFEGLPLPWLDEREYRIIKEQAILATIEYGAKDAIEKRLWNIIGPTATDEVRAEFDVIPKDTTCKTISGTGDA